MSLGCRFQLGSVSASARRSLLSAVIELVDQDRGEPLRQKQERKTRGDDLVGFRRGEGRVPAPPQSRLPFDQVAGPFAVPIVIAEEPLARKAAGPLDAIQVIENPARSVSRIHADGKIAFEPFHGMTQRGRRARRFIAALWCPVRVGVVSGRAEHLLADDQRADARAGHAARAGVALVIAPTAIAVLGIDEMLEREFPGLAADFDAGNRRLAESEDGKLGVAVVFAAASVGTVTVIPHSRVRTAGGLHAFEPFGQRGDSQLVAVPILGRDEGHQHERRFIRPARIVEGPQIAQEPFRSPDPGD